MRPRNEQLCVLRAIEPMQDNLHSVPLSVSECRAIEEAVGSPLVLDEMMVCGGEVREEEDYRKSCEDDGREEG